MKSATSGLDRGLHDPFSGQIALGGSRRTEHDDFSVVQVRSDTIGLRSSEDGRDAELIAGARNASSHLAAIRDEKSPKSIHGRAP
jgi:hypothetical protein